MDTWLYPAAAALYGAASALYLAYVARLREPWAGRARAVLLVAAAVHLCAIGAMCLRGLHPVRDVREALSLTSWFLVVGYLAATLRFRVAPIGAMVAPAALIVLLLARLRPAAAARAGAGAIGELHIALATVGLAAFALAAFASALYLVQEAQIRRGRFSALFHRVPPLATLDELGRRAVTLGFPVFTVALIAGAWWLARLGPAAGAWSRPEYPVAVIAWLAFAALLVARLTAGWRGRRAALLTLLGFACALLVVGLYLVRSAGS